MSVVFFAKPLISLFAPASPELLCPLKFSVEWGSRFLVFFCRRSPPSSPKGESLVFFVKISRKNSDLQFFSKRKGWVLFRQNSVQNKRFAGFLKKRILQLKIISQNSHIKQLTIFQKYNILKLQIGEKLICKTKNEYGKTVVRR